ncbi:MAG: hypothetical protein COB02_01925 [Candidatus Cloacimonadota bacterium]|nr:MAG: hypothetical protein COB02_01925 [Candidatus Cloacimonadota bacterium]
MNILIKIKFKLLYYYQLLIGQFNFYILDYFINILPYLNCDFSKYGIEESIAINGKKYSVHDPEYWDIMWKHWGDSKKNGKNYYQDISKFIANKNDKLNILEIGCGPGYLAELLKFNNNIASYVGVDISKASINTCKTKLSSDDRFLFKVENIEDTLNSLDDFDIIVAIDVLEHLPNNILNKLIYSINNTKKIFYFITPYLNYVPTPEHIQVYSKVKLKHLFFQHQLSFLPYSNFKEICTSNDLLKN